MNEIMKGALSLAAVLSLTAPVAHAQQPLTLSIPIPPVPPIPPITLSITCQGAATCTQAGGKLTITVPPNGAGRDVSGTTDLLSKTDCWNYVNYTGTQPVTVTVPNTLSTPCDIALWQYGQGSISVVAGSGVTQIPSPYGWTKSAGQGAILLVHSAKVTGSPSFVITGEGAP